MVAADKLDAVSRVFFLALHNRPQRSFEGISAPGVQSREDVLVTFRDFHVSVGRSTGTTASTDPTGQMTVVLYGDIYLDQIKSRQETLAALLARYAAQDVIALAQSLNGSFLLCILDKNKNNVFVITDRLNSKTAFLYRSADGTYISTSLRFLPTRKVDPAGCALYLTNTFIFGNRTVLRDVNTLQRASVYSLSLHDLQVTHYWDYTLSGSAVNLTSDQAIAQLSGLMRTATRRRVPAKGNVFVSLSGGIDSRAVLGLLLEEVPKDRLIAFSYGDPSDEDVSVAKQVASASGVHHEYVRFGGDLLATIKRNGELCEGKLPFYTHGVDGICQLADRFDIDDVLFVADLSVQRGIANFRNLDEVLSRGIQIHLPIAIPSYYSCGDHRASVIRETLESDLEELKQRCAHLTHIQDLHDFLFVDQRTANMLLPWRQFHAGRFITVVNALLDSDILDFNRSLARVHRLDKSLHRAATQSMFPKLCAIKFGKTGVSNEYAHHLLWTQRAEILDWLASTDSALDELLPPDLVQIAFIDATEAIGLGALPVPGRVRAILDRLRRKRLRYRFAGGRAGRRMDGNAAVALPALGAEQIELMLSLRHFLAA